MAAELLCRKEKSIFVNETNNFTIMRCIVLSSSGEVPENAWNHDGSITCIGIDLPQSEDVNIKMEGDWKEKEYKGTISKQFHVSKFQSVIPESTDGFIRFLRNGNIPGIGKRLAVKILETYPDNAYDIVKNDTQKLLEIKGFSEKKVNQIHDYFEENEILIKIMDELSNEITMNDSRSIYKYFGLSAIDKIKESIFSLYPVKGFNFQNLTKLARILNRYNATDSLRIQSAFVYSLQQAANQGHTFLFENQLIENTEKLLNFRASTTIPSANITTELVKMSNPVFSDISISSTKINIDGKVEVAYALNQFYSAEKFAAKRVNALSHQKKIITNTSILKDLMKDLKIEISKDDSIEDKELKVITELMNRFSKETSLLPSKMQKEAIKQAQKENFLIVTGGPGTGKTTIERFMIHLMEKLRPDADITLLAPTGRAASRMSESTGYTGAKTIHSAVKIFGYDEEQFEGLGKLETDIIFVDEFSMVDTLLFKCLLQAMEKGTQIIMIGDPDQLPSVQAGNVFKDLIDSKCVPLVKLDHVFRQGLGSLISINAQLINKGDTHLNFNKKDFNFISAKGNSMKEIEIDCAKEIEGLYAKLIAEHGVDKVQILAPYRVAESKKNGYRYTSVEAMNKTLQPVANPFARLEDEGIKINTYTFFKNDKIMETSNQNKEDISNGDVGKIINISATDKSMDTIFNESTKANYEMKDMISLQLAYATTIHKSQGSEYPYVIIPALKSYRGMLSKQLLYTAVTRAKKGVFIVGEMSALFMAIHDDFTQQRQTLLCHLLLEEEKQYKQREEERKQQIEDSKTEETLVSDEQLELQLPL